mmetsp:Transcript_27969/g.91669  ORF Transcript_27969/g.91669 Transcript_27969/m.91669 type:complete len:480 (+) Transcript_27969:50-1489(+)
MASLDAFLADLDDLNEEEDEGEEEEIIEEEDDDDGDIDMLAETGGGGAAGTSGLLASSRMASLMEKIEAYMVADAGDGVVAPPAAPQDDAGAVYALIVQCNEIAVDIDNEVEALAKHIRDDYAKRFPELESLIPNPLDFARVVLKIGNEADLTQVDLTGILPSATIMVVTVTSSTTIGTELPPQALAAVSERCEQVLALSDNKQRILAFVESKMAIVAPNVVAIVGAATAAKLVGAAGGMSKLAELPSTVVQILGSKKRALAGMSTSTQVTHSGCISQCDIILNTPPGLRPKVVRMVAGKVTLAARADAYQNSGDGSVGQKFRDEIEMRSAKLSEPPPPKDVRPLAVPPESSGKRRGGRRLRKMKERMGMTHMRQLSNRVRFGQEEDMTSDGMLGVGMLGKSQQGGKVKVNAQKQQLLSEKNKRARLAGSSGSTNGLASSLAFTPVQGIELVNPSAAGDSKEGTETYFSQTAAFFQRGM